MGNLVEVFTVTSLGRLHLETLSQEEAERVATDVWHNEKIICNILAFKRMPVDHTKRA